ncbi:MAG TPA: HAD-IB family hydrolase [Rubrivivax sp.]
MKLALFDLDQTLLSGDSDVLWCRFLVEHGVLERSLLERNDEMAARYADGTVTPAAFCNFFASTLAGHDSAHWAPWRERFLQDVVRPRIPADARALLQRHRDAGDTLLLTTATNRVLTELTAADLGIEHLLATELEERDGVYTGRIRGKPNMRRGKLEHLLAWLAASGRPATRLKYATFYSDSINDLPLLSAVGHPIAVDPDARLESAARRHLWPILRLERGNFRDSA